MLGFPFFYELLTRSIDIRILEDDDPHILGALMLQMLPERESTADGLLPSILRAVAFNPHVADRMIRLVVVINTRGRASLCRVFIGCHNQSELYLRARDQSCLSDDSCLCM